MLLFDSAAIGAEERYDAICELLRHATHPASFETIAEDGSREFEFRAWQLAPESSMFSAAGTGMSLRRGCSDRFVTDTPLVCLSVQPSGHARSLQGGDERILAPGALWVTNMCDAYDYEWDGWGASSTYQIGVDALGLSPADVALASPRLASSVLYPLVRDHLVSTAEYVNSFAEVDAGLEASLRDLFRALLVSALDEEPSRILPDDDEVLWAAVDCYLRRHLRDPRLTEQRIAVDSGVGSDRLRRLTDARGVSVLDLLWMRRLEGARAELAVRAVAPGAAESAARRWGFDGPAHLTGMLAAAYEAGSSDWIA